MNERAELAGGHATIHSRPHQGTTITVRVPKGPSSP
jgi:signal transduction histidine kinase